MVARFLGGRRVGFLFGKWKSRNLGDAIVFAGWEAAMQDDGVRMT